MILGLLLLLGISTALACGSIVLAAQSAPPGRHTRVDRSYLLWGAALSAAGGTVMALGAWSTHEDTIYDDFGLAMFAAAVIMGGALFVLGLGPFISWLLGILGRWSARLPAPIRPAAHDLAGHRARTGPAVAVIIIATAFATTFMIAAAAENAQGRAWYEPSGRPGALLVPLRSDQDPANVRTAVQQELPGVPITQVDRPLERGDLRGDSGTVEPIVDVAQGRTGHPDTFIGDLDTLIGDQALLRYLTGDPSTPYDANSAVLVTAHEVAVDRLSVRFTSFGTDTSKDMTIPAIVVRAPDPRVENVFLPAEAVRALGYDLEPDELIIDPTHHRVSPVEQERLDRRLSGAEPTHLERGFQPSNAWRVFALAGILAALGGALATTATGPRARRVRLRISAGSRTTLRLLIASHAALGAAFGAVLGAAAGCVIGLLLAWPMTGDSDWEAEPRVGFDTPWLMIAAMVAGLPLLAAAVAGLFRPGTPPSAAPARPGDSPGDPSSV
ncbi:hypothetical protein ABZT47_30850 [Sphaerisporangium sp. NPDC005289]|uniref:hypothetical protein n=1 Tax=Sphaerisporangium sp. NPDC005289 TaxID=3155247 RepID=UPI00339EB5FC